MFDIYQKVACSIVLIFVVHRGLPLEHRGVDFFLDGIEIYFNLLVSKAFSKKSVESEVVSSGLIATKEGLVLEDLLHLCFP